MLRRNYNSCVVGFNYISLIDGIIKLKDQKSVLLVDNEKYSFANKWFLNIGELEKGLLQEIGRKHDITSLKNIEKYLKQQNTIFVLNEKILELTDSYYLNIKEIARKFPDSISKFFIDELESVDQGIFDKEIIYLLKKIQEKSFQTSHAKDLDKLFDSNQVNTKNLFKSFSNYLQLDDDLAKQMHFILQMTYQNVFSNEVFKLESIYLFLSLLSKRYEIDHKKLTDDLIFEFRKLGGDIKKTLIEDWGVKSNQMRYILLKSVDGLIEIDNCHYFGQLSLQNKFQFNLDVNKFSSIDISYTLKHPYVEHYQNKRIICSDQKKMGSDFPFWEFNISHLGELTAVYSYTDQLGTKANFYYKQALEDLFTTLNFIFPGIDRDHWFANARFSKGLDIWFEYQNVNKQSLLPKNSSRKGVKFLFEDKKVGSVEFYGPERGQVMGFYGYLLDLFSHP